MDFQSKALLSLKICGYDPNAIWSPNLNFGKNQIESEYQYLENLKIKLDIICNMNKYRLLCH